MAAVQLLNGLKVLRLKRAEKGSRCRFNSAKGWVLTLTGAPFVSHSRFFEWGWGGWVRAEDKLVCNAPEPWIYTAKDLASRAKTYFLRSR